MRWTIPVWPAYCMPRRKVPILARRTSSLCLRILQGDRVKKQHRPVFLNPLKIAFPASAKVSILHRLSGLLLFLAIPVALALLRRSLSSAEELARLTDVAGYGVPTQSASEPSATNRPGRHRVSFQCGDPLPAAGYARRRYAQSGKPQRRIRFGHRRCGVAGGRRSAVVARVVGGAHYGLRDWLAQRVSAAILAIYMVLLAVFLVAHRPLQYADWKGLFDQAWMRIFSLVFVVSLCIHAWVGMRNIFMDYVPATGLRLLLHIFVIVALVAYLLWAVQILWSL